MRKIEAILEEASALAVRARESDIYREYCSAAEELEREPELKVLTDAFRKERYLAYEALAGATIFTQLEALEEQQERLAAYPQIVRFLNAETAWCRFLQKLQAALTAGQM